MKLVLTEMCEKGKELHHRIFTLKGVCVCVCVLCVDIF
jgi:hypothetical protein